MKLILCIILGCMIFFGVPMLMLGCASIDEVRNTVTRTQKEYSTVIQALSKSSVDVESAVAAYKNALLTGDTKFINAATAGVLAAAKGYDNARVAVEAVKAAFVISVQELKEGKESGVLWERLLGLGITAVGGFFGVAGTLGARTAKEALGGATRVVEGLKNGGNWSTEKLVMKNTLSARALKLIDKLRPKRY